MTDDRHTGIVMSHGDDNMDYFSSLFKTCCSEEHENSLMLFMPEVLTGAAHPSAEEPLSTSSDSSEGPSLTTFTSTASSTTNDSRINAYSTNSGCYPAQDITPTLSSPFEFMSPSTKMDAMGLDFLLQEHRESNGNANYNPEYPEPLLSSPFGQVSVPANPPIPNDDDLNPLQKGYDCNLLLGSGAGSGSGPDLIPAGMAPRIAPPDSYNALSGSNDTSCYDFAGINFPVTLGQNYHHAPVVNNGILPLPSPLKRRHSDSYEPEEETGRRSSRRRRSPVNYLDPSPSPSPKPCPAKRGGEKPKPISKRDYNELSPPSFVNANAGSFGFMNLRKPGAWTRVKAGDDSGSHKKRRR
uniref:ARAD1C06314p n=1 Tax=Blastobotrys adeninivorans TaxID=409370 RepID=A0A060T4V7_BLAAD